MLSLVCGISIVFYTATCIPDNGTQHHQEMKSAPTTVSTTEIIRPLRYHHQAETDCLFWIYRRINNSTGVSASYDRIILLSR